jgi:hypothetical protein
VTVPFGTKVSALVPVYATTGASVTVNGAAQVSGVTANDFTGPVPYTVTAADGSAATYVITVTVEPTSWFMLTIVKAGPGPGTVAVGPSELQCGNPCVAAFPPGASVELTAEPAAGARFAGWSGACTDAGSCRIVMDSDKVVTAAFARAGTRVSAGWSDACLLRDDGTVACWGDSSYGKSLVPSGRFVDVAAGYHETCAIQIDGTVACWGNDTASYAPPAGTFKKLAAGLSQMCGIRTDDSISCWGTDIYTSAVPAGSFIDVTVGGFEDCAIRSNGNYVCWGSSGYCSGATAPPPQGSFTAVAGTGMCDACALGLDGAVACWGDKGGPPGAWEAIAATDDAGYGIRTDGTIGCFWNEACDAPEGPFTSISMGDSYGGKGTPACAVGADGAVVCWGDDYYGAATVPTDESFIAIAAGGYEVCRIRQDGSISCWGGNLPAPPSGTFTAVGVGDNFACALDTGGAISCWSNDAEHVPEPPVEDPPVHYSAVSVGGQHACGLVDDGSLMCWGDDADGRSTPPAGSFSSVSVGYVHSCAVQTDGAVACWGTNRDGECTPPSNDGPYVSVYAGFATTCAIRTDGSVACWGNDSVGQGDPPAGVTFMELGLAPGQTCSIRTDGTLASWGRYDQSLPAGEFTMVTAGWGSSYPEADFCCALDEQGHEFCWGGIVRQPL